MQKLKTIIHWSSWVLVAVSILIHAVTLVPTAQAIELFLANIVIVAGINVLARRGY